MEPENTTAGDYGYDMAHQEQNEAAASERRTDREAVTPSPVFGKPDLAEDFGYDQAHDFQ
jgi:hypothetical protein